MTIYYPRASVTLGFILDYPAEARIDNFVFDNLAGFGSGALESLRRRFPEIAARFDANLAHIVTVSPHEIQHTIHPYTQADTCRIKIDYRNFPFDPRLARAVAVEVHLGTAPSIDAPFDTNQSTLRFVGYADTGDWAWGDDDTITLECRDHTALLLDTPWLDRGQIDLQDDLYTIIRTILDTEDATAQMVLDIRPQPVPKLADDRGDIAGDKHTAAARQSLWDTITEIVSEAGLIAWVEGRKLIVDAAQTLIGLPAIPFIAGRNLEDLRVRRHVGRKRTPPVTIDSWDPTTKKVLTATYPPNPATNQPDAQTTTQRTLRFTVSNIKENKQDVLERIAKNVWTRFALQDINVEFQTHDLRGPRDEHLLDLKPGTPVAIHFSDEERLHLHGRPYDQRRAYLVHRGYPPRVATAIAHAYQQLTPAYQIVQVQQRYHADRGIALTFQCASYLTGD